MLHIHSLGDDGLGSWLPVNELRMCVLQWLMTDPSSPIIDFYPLDFQLDGEGKRQEWEAVAVLGFVDEPRLRAAAASVPQTQLSPEEIRRNEFGRVLHFRHAPGDPTVAVFATFAKTFPQCRSLCWDPCRCERMQRIGDLLVNILQNVCCMSASGCMCGIQDCLGVC